MLKWVLTGMPVYYGTAYGAGRNVSTVLCLVIFIWGLYLTTNRTSSGGKNHGIWVQRADSSIEEVQDQGSQAAIRVLQTTDWENARLAGKQILKSASVPPGLGLGSFGDDHFIHIMPTSVDVADVLYACKKTASRKPLGTMSAQSSKINQLFRKNVPFSQVHEIIHAYYQNDGQKLCRLLTNGVSISRDPEN